MMATISVNSGEFLKIHPAMPRQGKRFVQNNAYEHKIYSNFGCYQQSV